MIDPAKKKAAQKWLAAELKKKMIPLIGEEVENEVSEERLRAIIVETMSEAVPWMQELLGKDFKPQNALEFFALALEDDKNG